MLKKISSMFKNKDIRSRILFTLAMLFIFRFGAAITVPGVDMSAMTNANRQLIVRDDQSPWRWWS